MGSGSIHIGKGTKFGYACVHCVGTLKKLGYEVIVINNNSETVSADFDIGDRLYFEPLCINNVMQIINREQPEGVIASFGDSAAIKLARPLQKLGVKIIGIPADIADNFKKVTALFKVIRYRLLAKQLIFYLMLLKISCLTIV